MFKIGVLISGGGSNLQSIIDGIDCGELRCEIHKVISDRKDAGGIKRCMDQGIDWCVFDRKEMKKSELSNRILEEVEDVDLIVLAGFLSILQGDILKKFKGRIINIHPSLIPKYCGRGMYGEKVHKAVIENNEKESGCTVHFVDEGTDTGPIIKQAMVPVKEDETIESLKNKVLKEEHKLLVDVVKEMINGRGIYEKKSIYKRF